MRENPETATAAILSNHSDEGINHGGKPAADKAARRESKRQSADGDSGTNSGSDKPETGTDAIAAAPANEGGEDPDSLDAAISGVDSDTGSDSQGSDGTSGPGDGAGVDAAGDNDAGQSDSQESERSLNALAEKLDVDVADLYETEIPMADGETMTLGALKDLAAEAGDMNLARASLEVDRRDNENAVMTAKSEMGAMISLLGEAATPQVLERARQEMAIMQERERRATIEAIPAWKDPIVYAQARENITGHLRGYGFSPAEVSHVHDHRLLKLVADATEDRARIKGALENVKATRADPNKPGKQAKRETRQQSRTRKSETARTGTKDQKVAAIGDLIR